MMTSEKRTSEFFDCYAHDFSAIYGTRSGFFKDLINRFFRKSMMIRYQKTVDGCDPIDGKTVIDIGCGPGHYGIALASKGAGHVLGIDFAEAMIDLARRNAVNAGVEDRCDFVCDDFLTYETSRRFDYCILMGFMDYVADPGRVIEKVLSITGSKAFFSFPAEGGLLAWQRKLRYKRKCDLYLYAREHLESLFSRLTRSSVAIEKIERDFFVTVAVSEPEFG